MDQWQKRLENEAVKVLTPAEHAAARQELERKGETERILTPKVRPHRQEPISQNPGQSIASSSKCPIDCPRLQRFGQPTWRAEER